MSDEQVVGGEDVSQILDKLQALVKRDKCCSPVFDWQCWCPTCTARLLKTYIAKPNSLPLSVRGRIETA